MGVMTARAPRNARLARLEQLSMLARPILLKLIHGQERLALLHVFDVTMTAAAELDPLPGCERAAVSSSLPLGKVFVGFCLVSAVARDTRDPPTRVDVDFPKLAHPILGREMTLKALPGLSLIDLVCGVRAFHLGGADGRASILLLIRASQR
jgi:hypothetical protein